MLGKYGKRKVSFCAVAITVPAFSMLSVITKDITTPYLIAFAVITGPGCACGFYIPWVSQSVFINSIISIVTITALSRKELWCFFSPGFGFIKECRRTVKCGFLKNPRKLSVSGKILFLSVYERSDLI